MRNKNQKKKKESKYTIIDHTADIGLKVIGKNFYDLVKNALEGLYNIICDVKKVEPRRKYKVVVSGKESNTASNDLFLVKILNEFIYITATKHLLFRKFMIDKSTSEMFSYDKKIVVWGYGEEYDYQRHGHIVEVKAATYHKVFIRKKNRYFYTKVFFDM